MASPLSTLWTHIHPSICSLTFSAGGNRLSSGTGFKVGARLLTNNHVIQVPGATHVTLRFVGADGLTDTASKTLPMSEFETALLDGDPETGWDFAILDLAWPEFKSIPSLALSPSTTISIGDPIALLGYQFENPNLSIHSGIVASRYTKASVKYLQLDASVNHGNSGGPLIDPESCLVIGIVTRKATGLTAQFDELLQSFDQNIKALSGAKSIMALGPVDPIEALSISQEQMKRVSLEIRRSANVGIGYAYELDKIRTSGAIS